MSAPDSTPDDLLARHPETAYFWGHVAGGGRVTDRSVEVTVTDEDAARRLSAIAGGGTVDHRIAEREFAHDTSVTRQSDEYTVQIVDPTLAANAAAAFGLPVGSDPGGYRFDAFRAHRRALLRGLFEACGVVCFRESSAAVGVSFVHDDARLLARIRTALDAEGFDAEEPQPSASGGHWFGVADPDTAAFGEWVYEGADESGLYAADRRRKTLRSVERATGVAVGSLIGPRETEEAKP
ncbi:cobalamin biosynthesis protein [Halorubrum salipaludis]|uniref:Cobalamin biosynthesis protein n=1 Tax=Halorubrum salipaludis TaxID=2032630 RepID=A0A2A2FIW2_9EURY|nr:cobalamin biosynthesis protein [Halorubrum salipaludis]PAU84694.1 cobalamin biosynthesis protein [Halorubrum salipaludis]